MVAKNDSLNSWHLFLPVVPPNRDTSVKSVLDGHDTDIAKPPKGAVLPVLRCISGLRSTPPSHHLRY